MKVCKHVSKGLKCTLMLELVENDHDFYHQCPFTDGNRITRSKEFCKHYEEREVDLWGLNDPVRVIPMWLKDEIDKKLYFHNDPGTKEREIITDTLQWVLSLEERDSK